MLDVTRRVFLKMVTAGVIKSQVGCPPLTEDCETSPDFRSILMQSFFESPQETMISISNSFQDTPGIDDNEISELLSGYALFKEDINSTYQSLPIYDFYYDKSDPNISNEEALKEFDEIYNEAALNLLDTYSTLGNCTPEEAVRFVSAMDILQHIEFFSIDEPHKGKYIEAALASQFLSEEGIQEICRTEDAEGCSIGENSYMNMSEILLGLPSHEATHAVLDDYYLNTNSNYPAQFFEEKLIADEGYYFIRYRENCNPEDQTEETSQYGLNHPTFLIFKNNEEEGNWTLETTALYYFGEILTSLLNSRRIGEIFGQTHPSDYNPDFRQEIYLSGQQGHHISSLIYLYFDTFFSQEEKNAEMYISLTNDDIYEILGKIGLACHNNPLHNQEITGIDMEDFNCDEQSSMILLGMEMIKNISNELFGGQGYPIISSTPVYMDPISILTTYGRSPQVFTQMMERNATLGGIVPFPVCNVEN